MEELTGGIVQIVLNINEGQGFEGINSPILMTANLNGHKLESDIISPSSNPYFGTDLVWEAEKKTVKRLRTVSTVIKLEFFSCVNGKERDRIGFILVHLKTAQVISKKSNCKLVESWHKILGLKTRSKISRPEVLLSLRIEDIIDVETANIPKSSSELSRKTVSKSEIKNDAKSIDDEIHNASEKPFVQVGPLHLTHEMFHFTVIIGPAYNLLESFSRLVISSTSNCIHFAYSIFGEYVSTSPISDDSYLSKSTHFVKSSYSFLNSYFQQNSSLNLALYHGTNKIGSAGISLQPFSCNDVKFHYELESKNFFRITERCQIFFESSSVNLDANLNPSVDVMITVTKIDPKFEACIIYKSTDKPKSVVNTPKSLENHDIKTDGTKCIENLKLDERIDTYEANASDEKSLSPRLPHPSVGNEQKIFINDNHVETSLQSSYPLTSGFGEQSVIICSLVVSIDSIVFKVLPNEGKFSFKFYHPKASKIVSSGVNVVKETNKVLSFPRRLAAKLNFKLSPVDLERLHQSPLEIFIEHSAGVFAQVKFFPPSINNREYSCLGIAEGNSEVMTCGCSKPVSFLYVTLSLEPENSSSQAHDKLSVKVLDEPENKELIYRVVEELEDWKEKQEIMFKYKLKEREEMYLKNLSEEWEKQRKELERKLVTELKLCENLRTSLNATMEEFHQRFHRLAQKETKLAEQAAEEERKNQFQRQCLAEASKKIDEMMQTHKILSEKLAAATQSKLFFKEQWARAVRELHRVKSESGNSFMPSKSLENINLKRFEAEEAVFNDTFFKKFNLRPEAFIADEFDNDIQNMEYDPALFSDQFETEPEKEKEVAKKSNLLSAERESTIQKLNNRIRGHLMPTL